MADPKVGTTPTPAQAASTPVPGQSTPPSFTPGPYEASKHERGTVSGRPDKWEYVKHHFPDYPYEGDLYDEYGIYPPPGEAGPVALVAGRDNALLFHAAPELYKALSDLVKELPDVAIDCYSEVAGNTNASVLRAKRSAAMKALARARGEVAQ